MTALCIVIPHYNDSVRLARCLEALMAQDLTGVEVVVADNASSQDLAPVRARFGTVRFVTQPQAGAGLARNAGAQVSTTPWIAFLDADCVPGPDWVSRAKRIAAGDTGTITGGRVDLFDETPPPRSGAEAFETVFAFDQTRYIRDKGFSVTANLLVPRAVFERAGPFRAGLSEDLEWCHRATATGARLVYDPDLAVRHPTRADWPALRRKWRRLTEEGFGLRPPTRLSRLAWGARGLAMIPSILVHLPRIWRCRDLTIPERIRASATLIRLRMARMVWMGRQALGLKP